MNERFQRAIELIDAANAQDPRHEIVDGKPIPYELLYSQRLTDWVLRLRPNASEALRLAGRSQHICRWKIPRSNYPATKAGYHQWKNELKKFHADETEKILHAVGYEPNLIDKVQAFNLKLSGDDESRTLEDALCLVFLEFQFADLAQRAEPEKVINAVRKSWNKMTPSGREAALQLQFGLRERELLAAALSAQVLS